VEKMTALKTCPVGGWWIIRPEEVEGQVFPIVYNVRLGVSALRVRAKKNLFWTS
jgi:hypothetical protein